MTQSAARCARLGDGALLVIDQAEELVQAAGRGCAAGFFAFLAELRDEYEGLHIALAVRDDALAQMLAASRGRGWSSGTCATSTSLAGMNCGR